MEEPPLRGTIPFGTGISPPLGLYGGFPPPGGSYTGIGSSLPGLEGDPYIPNPVPEFARTKSGHLRILFFARLCSDPHSDAPFKRFLHHIRARLYEEAPVRAREARANYWAKCRGDFITEKQREIVRDIRASFPTARPETIEETARTAANHLADHVGRTLLADELSEGDIRSGIWHAARQLSRDEGWITTAAEDVAYKLRLSPTPHSWLTACMTYEGKRLLEDEQAKTFPIRDPAPSTWEPAPRRRDPLPEAPRKQVIARLFVDQSDEEHRASFAEAQEKVRAMRTPKRGRRPWDGKAPSDAELVRLLYQNLRGTSYQKLSQSDPVVRGTHPKTLQDRLHELRNEIFGDEELTDGVEMVGPPF